MASKNKRNVVTKAKSSKKAPAKPATKPKEAKPMTRKHDDVDAPETAPFESGDLHKDHTAAKEDVNRAAVHIADRLRIAFERMGSNVEKKHVAHMQKITKSLQSVLEDVDALAAKEEKAAAEGGD